MVIWSVSKPLGSKLRSRSVLISKRLVWCDLENSIFKYFFSKRRKGVVINGDGWVTDACWALWVFVRDLEEKSLRSIDLMFLLTSAASLCDLLNSNGKNRSFIFCFPQILTQKGSRMFLQRNSGKCGTNFMPLVYLQISQSAKVHRSCCRRGSFNKIHGFIQWIYLYVFSGHCFYRGSEWNMLDTILSHLQSGHKMHHYMPAQICYMNHTKSTLIMNFEPTHSHEQTRPIWLKEIQ